MFGQMDLMNAATTGLNRMSGDAAQRREATRRFEKLLNTAARKRRTARLRGRDRAMQQLSAEVNRHDGQYIGLRTVSLDAIIGTESRAEEFDREFLPLSEHVLERWISVASAFMRGVTLPPIELIQVGDAFFVRDGHHRISVYRAFGQATVEAEVICYG